MTGSNRTDRATDQYFTTVDDEQYTEISQLAGARVVHVSVWEDSMVAALEQDAGDDEFAVDLDVYLDRGVYFECYGVACFPTLVDESLATQSAVERTLAAAVGQGAWLDEIAVDEDDALVLVLARHHRPLLYLQVSAWLLEEWDELPESPDS